MTKPPQATVCYLAHPRVCRRTRSFSSLIEGSNSVNEGVRNTVGLAMSFTRVSKPKPL